MSRDRARDHHRMPAARCSAKYGRRSSFSARHWLREQVCGRRATTLRPSARHGNRASGSLRSFPCVSCGSPAVPRASSSAIHELPDNAGGDLRLRRRRMQLVSEHAECENGHRPGTRIGLTLSHSDFPAGAPSETLSSEASCRRSWSPRACSRRSLCWRARISSRARTCARSSNR